MKDQIFMLLIVIAVISGAMFGIGLDNGYRYGNVVFSKICKIKNIAQKYNYPYRYGCELGKFLSKPVD